MKKSLVLSGLIALSAVSLTACGASDDVPDASGDVPDGRYYKDNGSGIYIESSNNGEQCTLVFEKSGTNYDCVFDKENKEFTMLNEGALPTPYEVKGNDLIMTLDDGSSATYTREDY